MSSNTSFFGLFFVAIVTRRQYKKMQTAGFNSAFEILITRNIELDKFILLGKPRKLTNRRSSLGPNIGRYMAGDDLSGLTGQEFNVSGSSDAIISNGSGSTNWTGRGNNISGASDTIAQSGSSDSSVSTGSSGGGNNVCGASDTIVTSGGAIAPNGSCDPSGSSDGSGASAAGDSAQADFRTATTKAMEIWNKWSTMTKTVPFSLRGRRRNSMFAEMSLNLPSINEE